MAKLPDNPLVSELFTAVHGKKNKADKVKLLKEHTRDDVKALIIWNYDKGIVSALRQTVQKPEDYQEVLPQLVVKFI